MATSRPRRTPVSGIMLAACVLCAAPLLGGSYGRAFAQSPSIFAKAPVAPAYRRDLSFYGRLDRDGTREATAGRRHTGVLIGTAAGAAVGWLIGRSQGDNFSTKVMIPLAALGALIGLAFSSHK